jgi:hypothetical protein
VSAAGAEDAEGWREARGLIVYQWETRMLHPTSVPILKVCTEKHGILGTTETREPKMTFWTPLGGFIRAKNGTENRSSDWYLPVCTAEVRAGKSKK